MYKVLVFPLPRKSSLETGSDRFVKAQILRSPSELRALFTMQVPGPEFGACFSIGLGWEPGFRMGRLLWF